MSPGPGRARRTLGLAREGVPFVSAALSLLAVSAAWAATGGGGGRLAAPLLAGAAVLFVAYFFRDPGRRPPADASAVVSPADGRVVSVETVEASDAGIAAFMDGEATRIAIFLSIFDVHVQRAPLAGSVQWYEYERGGYMAAWRKEAGVRNERASLGVVTDRGPVVVRQVAGWAARRIATYPRAGDRLAHGERIGLIRFGSRVELFLPRDWPAGARPGDRVRGGETVVARTGGDDDAADGRPRGKAIATGASDTANAAGEEAHGETGMAASDAAAPRADAS